MTYIWNRADRVDPKLMPRVVEEAFQRWQAEQFKNFRHLSEERKLEVRRIVSKQLREKNCNLIRLGYIK